MMKLTKIRNTLRTTFCHLSRSYSRFQARNELLVSPRALIISVRVPIFTGIKAPNEIKKAFNNAVNELAAIAWRSIGALAWTLCSGAIETATNIKPTSVAPIRAARPQFRSNCQDQVGHEKQRPPWPARVQDGMLVIHIIPEIVAGSRPV